MRDSSPTCDALAEAVSVTIALLLDDALPDRKAATSAPGATAPATHSLPADTMAARAHDLNANPWTGRASLEVGGGYGLGGSGGLFGFGRAATRHGRWLYDLGVGANLPREQGFQNGSVRTSLLFGSLRACYLLGQSLLIAPCVPIGAGFYATLAATPWVPTRRQTFSVENQLMYNLWHPETHWYPAEGSADFPANDVVMNVDWLSFEPE